MGFPGGFRGQTGPPLANTPTKTTTSKPVVPLGFFTAPSSVAARLHSMDQRMQWLPPATPTPASQPTSPEDVGLPPAEPRTGWRRLLGPLAVVGAILGKFK